MTIDCEKRTYKAGRKHFSRECDYAFADNRARLSKAHHNTHHSYEQASHLAGLRSRGRQSNQFLTQLFREHADRWKTDTGHMSSITRAIAHPSYLRIIGMGKKAIPLLLKELRERPDHWLVALNAITGEDPAPEGANFTEAVAAWVKWGEAKNLC
jgi:hypothetical protein